MLRDLLSFARRQLSQGQRRIRPMKARFSRLRLEALEDRTLLAAGALDPAFGIGGMVTTDFSSRNDDTSAIAVQADGKIVVAGTSAVSNSPSNESDFFLTRYNVDGTLDALFGSGGKVLTDFGPGDQAHSMVVQADGKLLVVGYTSNRSNYDFLLARYDANGTLDTTFGNDGKVTTDFGAIEVANGLIVQADGKIVLSGKTTTSGGSSDFAVARYDTNGLLDSTFGSGGKVTTDFANDQANNLAVQADGKLIVVGFTGHAFGGTFALARYDTNGSLDFTFGSGGKVTTGFGPPGSETAYGATRSDIVTSVVIQPDGKILTAGSSYGVDADGSFNGDFALARYKTDGTLDAGFGDGGKVITFIARSTGIDGVALQADGKIVVAGVDRNGTNDDIVVARYIGSNPSTTSAVASSVNASTLGQAVTLSVRVGDGSNIATSGTVTFYDNGTTVLGTGTFDSATIRWQLTLSNLSLGSHSITAEFAGNYYYDASSSPSPPLVQTVTSAGANASTTSAVASSANPSALGQVVMLSVRVGDATNVATSGSVIFFDGANLLGAGTFVAATGRWQLTSSSLSAGVHDIHASFGGSAYYAASVSPSPPLTQAVNPAGTNASTTSIVSSTANPSALGQAITLSVRVGDAMNVATSGTVSFFDGATLLGYGTLDPVTGRWRLPLSSLAAGSHSITATFGGNFYYAASASPSPPLVQAVR